MQLLIVLLSKVLKILPKAKETGFCKRFTPVLFKSMASTEYINIGTQQRFNNETMTDSFVAKWHPDLYFLPNKSSTHFSARGFPLESRASVVLWLTISPPRRETPGSIPINTKKIHDIYGTIWGKILCSAAICAACWFSCMVVPKPIV